MSYLKIKSHSTGKIVSIPRGTDFIVYPWGFSEVNARYTEDGKVNIYRRAKVCRGHKVTWEDVVCESYDSADKFLARWDNDVVIENTYGMEEYWDIAIYTRSIND